MLTMIIRRAIGGILFALLWAFPGAIIGIGAGYFGLQLVAAISSAVSFFIFYPRSMRKIGEPSDFYTYYMSACGGIGGGLGCYFVGGLIEGIKLGG